ncbi:hypothetical protein Saa2_02659 [Streptomyces acidiscabies]|nr:hypothetical protein Saa2_02659 [Streptomyces acidiscabies]
MSAHPTPVLILLCGLPGSGKTTLAKRLAPEIPAVRLCPDEWMDDLGIDLFDEEARERLERRFWGHAQELLGLGQTVVLEFGFWGTPSGTRSVRPRGRSGSASSCAISPCLSRSWPGDSKRGGVGQGPFRSGGSCLRST